MGKISDALEKNRKEKSIQVEKIPGDRAVSHEEKASESIEKQIFHPSSIANPKLVVHSTPDSFDAEIFRNLRTQILFPQKGSRKRSIMVTSAFPGEGKTFIAANLGVSIAQGLNEYVLLMDCDVRRPKLHEMFRYSNSEGIHEYITRKKELHELLIKTRIHKLTFLSAGRPPSNPAELLSSNQMKEFLTEVQERYQDRFVVLDSSPIQVTSEASVLSNYVEGVIFVVRAGVTPKAAVKRSIEAIGRDKIIGIVFNDFEKTLNSYGKYYKGYYK